MLNHSTILRDPIAEVRQALSITEDMLDFYGIVGPGTLVDLEACLSELMLAAMSCRKKAA